MRFLSDAYLLANDFNAAREVMDAGLELAPDDPGLISDRGTVKAARGDPEGAWPQQGLERLERLIAERRDPGQ